MSPVPFVNFYSPSRHLLLLPNYSCLFVGDSVRNVSLLHDTLSTVLALALLPLSPPPLFLPVHSSLISILFPFSPQYTLTTQLDRQSLPSLKLAVITLMKSVISDCQSTFPVNIVSSCFH